MAAPKTFNEAVQEFTDDLAKLLINKRLDYGAGNLAEFGTYGVLVRVSDKFHRLKNLSQKGTEPENEAITDTWQDIAGYAILALMIDKYGMQGYTALQAEKPLTGAKNTFPKGSDAYRAKKWAEEATGGLYDDISAEPKPEPKPKPEPILEAVDVPAEAAEAASYKTQYRNTKRYG